MHTRSITAKLTERKAERKARLGLADAVCYNRKMRDLVVKLRRAHQVAVFTGAGVSTLCGIPDFRGSQGLYKQPDAERIFDIDWFRRDPSVYYKGCMELVYGLKNFKPGPVHKAIVRLEQAGLVKGVITQVLVENAKPVEFGQPLFKVRPA